MTNKLKNIFFYRLPPLLYAIVILIVSSMPGATPPSLGVEWDDKIYHFLEFFILGFLCFRAFFNFPISQRNKKKIWLIFAIGIVFAVTDETLQYFIPRRVCSITDMMADSLGYFFGGVCFLWLHKQLNRKVDNN